MEVDDNATSPPQAREPRPDRVPASTTGRAFLVDSDSPSVSDSDDGWVRGRWRARSRSKSARAGRGPPTGLDDVDARGYSAGGDDSDEIVILGESTNRSQSPYDPAIHTIEEVDVPNSSPVHGEDAVGGVVGVGAWGPLSHGEGMDLDLVTDVAGAGDGARSGVSGLDSGQQASLRAAGAGVGLSAVHGVSARNSANLAESGDVEMEMVTTSRHRDDQQGSSEGHAGDGACDGDNDDVPVGGGRLALDGLDGRRSPTGQRANANRLARQRKTARQRGRQSRP
jgi:hypothetical protein